LITIDPNILANCRTSLKSREAVSRSPMPVAADVSSLPGGVDERAFRFFCDVIRSVRTVKPVLVTFTPAMAAGIRDHVWSIEEIVGPLDAAEEKAAQVHQ
jgi:hypothetical protein